MAFRTLGTAAQLQLQIPTKRTTGWSASLQTLCWQKIVEHDHSGSSGKGTPLVAGSIGADAVPDTSILMTNDGYLRWRNNADTANLNAIKVNTSDKLILNLEINDVLKLTNNKAIQHRNNADSAYISTINLNTSDKIALGADLANLAIINNTYFTGRNNADSAYINLIKVNTSDKIAIGADLANLEINNNTYIKARNNADSAYIDVIKVDISDKLVVNPEISAVVKISNNTAIQHRNQADSAYISTINLNTSNKIALGADLANLEINNDTYFKARNNADSAYINILKVNTSDKVLLENVQQLDVSIIDTTGSAALADNQAATTAGIITLASNEAAIIEYKILRGTNVQNGRLEIEESNAIVLDDFTGDDCGITFTLNAGDLEYASTSTGNAATMTYILIKK